MKVEYPVLDVKQFSYNKEMNIFTAKFRSLKCDLLLHKEFMMRNSKTGNEVIFLLVNNIYDLDECTCGLRFVPSYDDEIRFPKLQGCWVDVLFD